MQPSKKKAAGNQLSHTEPIALQEPEGPAVFDAVYCVALHYYVGERAAYGERVSLRAAARIAALAVALGIEPVSTALELGFDRNMRLLPRDLMVARSQLAGRGAKGLVERLSAAISGLSVSDMEAYTEGRVLEGGRSSGEWRVQSTPQSLARARTVEDAAYAQALHRYVVSRTRMGERVTVRAAARIADIAEALGMVPVRHLKALGFRLDGEYVRPLSHDDLWDVVQLLDGEARKRYLRPLCNAFEALQVSSVEQWEPGNA